MFTGYIFLYVDVDKASFGIMNTRAKNIIIFAFQVLGFFMVKLWFEIQNCRKKTVKLPSKMQIAVQKSWSNCTDSHLAIDCRLSGVTYTPLINAVSQSLHKKLALQNLRLHFIYICNHPLVRGWLGFTFKMRRPS